LAVPGELAGFAGDEHLPRWTMAAGTGFNNVHAIRRRKPFIRARASLWLIAAISHPGVDTKMSEFRCKLLEARLMATMCLGLVFTHHCMARASERDDQGFVPLFNGKDLSGFQTTGTWVFEKDGSLALKPKYRGIRLLPDYKSFLWTDATYDDFVLDLEFKVPKGGNSGVFLRSKSQRSYIQTQIRDSHGKAEPLGISDCGAVEGVAAPSKNMSKPAGQWNRMIITCQGERMQVELNGEQVINLDLNESRKTRTARSGRIGFENKSSPVAFRNVRIKELE
jgi:hypothetical protein